MAISRRAIGLAGLGMVALASILPILQTTGVVGQPDASGLLSESDELIGILNGPGFCCCGLPGLFLLIVWFCMMGMKHLE